MLKKLMMKAGADVGFTIAQGSRGASVGYGRTALRHDANCWLRKVRVWAAT